jgi:hypothetical protein
MADIAGLMQGSEAAGNWPRLAIIKHREMLRKHHDQDVRWR